MQLQLHLLPRNTIKRTLFAKVDHEFRTLFLNRTTAENCNFDIKKQPKSFTSILERTISSLRGSHPMQRKHRNQGIYIWFALCSAVLCWVPPKWSYTFWEYLLATGKYRLMYHTCTSTRCNRSNRWDNHKNDSQQSCVYIQDMPYFRCLSS